MLHTDVAKVDRDVAHLHMLQVFQMNVASVSANVSSVLDVCYKRFDLDVLYVSHVCCKSMF